MRRILAVLAMLLLLTLLAGAQHAAMGFCTLDQTVDFKTAKAGARWPCALRATWCLTARS